jgi:hypothetical protein
MLLLLLPLTAATTAACTSTAGAAGAAAATVSAGTAAAAPAAATVIAAATAAAFSVNHAVAAFDKPRNQSSRVQEQLFRSRQSPKQTFFFSSSKFQLSLRGTCLWPK